MNIPQQEIIPSKSTHSNTTNHPNSASSSNTSNSTTSSTSNNTNNSKKAIKFDRMTYVTVDELEDTPKYVKGRITLEKVNKAIDEFHSLLAVKYKILSTPMSKLSAELTQQYKAYKDQEIKDSKGLFFLMESDLKSSLMKPDGTGE